MVVLSRERYLELEQELEECCVLCFPLLEEQQRGSVRRYIEVGEIEMACELLVLKLMHGQVDIDSVVIGRLVLLGLELGLETESMSDPEFFWENFMRWVEGRV